MIIGKHRRKQKSSVVTISLQLISIYYRQMKNLEISKTKAKIHLYLGRKIRALMKSLNGILIRDPMESLMEILKRA